MNPKQSIRSVNAKCQCLPLNFSCCPLLKLPMLEDNLAYLNFVICRSMPSSLPIYSLFFFFTSSKTISGMSFSVNECQRGRLKLGKSSLPILSGNKFLPEAVAMFMIEPKSKSIKKTINNYFCLWTCLNSHGKLLVIFKFEQYAMKGNLDHYINF